MWLLVGAGLRPANGGEAAQRCYRPVQPPFPKAHSSLWLLVGAGLRPANGGEAAWPEENHRRRAPQGLTPFRHRIKTRSVLILDSQGLDVSYREASRFRDLFVTEHP